MRNLPPLNALRAFEAAGRHQSFSRAAEELGVSHSAISRHVRGLEARLTTQLFREEARGVALTSAGAHYLAQVSPAFDQIAEATESFTETATGELRVNVEPVFATRWLMPRLNSFHDRHPEVDLRLDSSELLADLSRFEADLAIRFFKEGLPEQPADLISNAPLYPYAAPGLIDVPLRVPEDVISLRLYQDRRGDMWARWFKNAGWDPALIPEERFRMRSSLCVEAAVNRMGVILASSEVMQYELELGRLVQLSDIPLFSGSYHLLYGEGTSRRKAVRAFRDWLLKESASLRFPEGPGFNIQPKS